MANAGSIILGTRKSLLAQWQTNHVRKLLEVVWPEQDFAIETIVTKGDKVLDKPLPLIGGKGLFTFELENALRTKAIDLAVHSLKDLPTDAPDGLTIGAIPERAEAGDVLISKEGHTLESLPQRATVGTSSRRRAAQLLHCRPDLCIVDIRGNVDTRLAKTLASDGPYDATILAHAGIIRLRRESVITEVLPDEVMLPAPGQGALGIQCRDERAFHHLLSPIAHARDTAEVTAERAFLARLGGGCSTPVSARGRAEEDRLTLTGRITAPDGSSQIQVSSYGALNEAFALGQDLAEMALGKGAANLIGAVAAS